MGILLPALSKAREKARQSSCLANLKQIGLGEIMYAQDYDGRHMDAGDNVNVATDSHSFRNLLKTYVPADPVWQCPSVTGSDTSAVKCSYFGNGMLGRVIIALIVGDGKHHHIPATVLAGKRGIGVLYSQGFILAQEFKSAILE